MSEDKVVQFDRAQVANERDFQQTQGGGTPSNGGRRWMQAWTDRLCRSRTFLAAGGVLLQSAYRPARSIRWGRTKWCWLSHTRAR